MIFFRRYDKTVDSEVFCQVNWRNVCKAKQGWKKLGLNIEKKPVKHERKNIPSEGRQNFLEKKKYIFIAKGDCVGSSYGRIYRSVLSFFNVARRVFK